MLLIVPMMLVGIEKNIVKAITKTSPRDAFDTRFCIGSAKLCQSTSFGRTSRYRSCSGMAGVLKLKLSKALCAAPLSEKETKMADCPGRLLPGAARRSSVCLAKSTTEALDLSIKSYLVPISGGRRAVGRLAFEPDRPFSSDDAELDPRRLCLLVLTMRSYSADSNCIAASLRFWTRSEISPASLTGHARSTCSPK